MLYDRSFFIQFEAQIESLIVETRNTIESSKSSDRLIDNRVRGFVIALVDTMAEFGLISNCKCGGVTTIFEDRRETA